MITRANIEQIEGMTVHDPEGSGWLPYAEEREVVALALLGLALRDMPEERRGYMIARLSTLAAECDRHPGHAHLVARASDYRTLADALRKAGECR